MRILLIGSGGREHALGLRLLQDPGVEAVFAYPGNPGMKNTPGLVPLPDSKITFESALSIVRRERISLVVIGPEWPLFQGWVDRFTREEIPAFGPTQSAAFLEESKIKSKLFMKENRIPTASFSVAGSLDETLAIINAHPTWDGYVLKLSGPALGKGVVVTHDSETAITAAQDFFKFMPPGIEEGLVVEEKIDGKEVSLFYACVSDGKHFESRFLASACDHKRLLDGDQGPNTGGMGAYSPANWVGHELLQDANELFVKPTLQGMIARGTPFSGILFLGLMVKNNVPYLLEYNTRFGDPETQTFLPRIKGNLAALLLASAKKDFTQFKETKLEENSLHSLHVVKAARGYPGLFGEKIESGKELLLKEIPLKNAQFYFAGVSENEGKLYSSGGRVLGLTVLADSVAEVQRLAYEKVKEVSFEGEQYRSDIGAKR